MGARYVVTKSFPTADSLLVHPGIPLALAAAYALYGVVTIATGTHLHDEGLLTFFFASWTTFEPAAVIFFQKSRPVLSLLYAPASLLGFEPFLVAHVLLAATAIPLTAATARRLGLRWPNLAAAIVACSPLQLAAGSAGVSNTDAVTGAIFVMWIVLGPRRPMLAAIVAGGLLLVRSELAVFVAVFLGWSIWNRELRSFWLGLPIVPAVYVLAGAIYHRDPIWIVHHPPALLLGNPAVSKDVIARYAGSAGDLALALLTLTPAVLLIPVLRFRQLRGAELASVLFAAVFILLIRGMPLLTLFNFDASPRYLLPALPFVALGATRALEQRIPANANVWAACAVVLMGVVGPTELAKHTNLRPTDSLRAATDWLVGNRQSVAGHRVITNGHLLAFELRRKRANMDVRYLVQADQREEIRRLTNARVGQTDAILRAMQRVFYAPPLYVDGALTPLDVESGTMLVLFDDNRLASVLPPQLWEPRLDEIAHGVGWRVGRVRASTSAQSRPMPSRPPDRSAESPTY